MEDWYRIVRNLKDESENPYMTQNFVYDVYHDLKDRKVKDKGKFRQRMGPEFDHWVAGMSMKYPPNLVIEVINDDTFWNQTMQVTKLS